MQKVYLLLRNNQQNGPYSLEELLQFNLKPVDLIWIEGKSAGWYYPQEIQALQPYLSFLNKPTQASPAAKNQTESIQPFEATKPKKVFVSMPLNAAVVKEERIQQPSHDQSSSAKEISTAFEPINPYSGTEGLKTTYAKSLEEIESEYTNWVYKKKIKKKPAVSRKGVVVAGLLVGFAIGGWFVVRSFSGSEMEQAVRQQSETTIPGELPREASAVATTTEVASPVKNKIKTIKKEAGTAPVVKAAKPEARHNNQEVAISRKPVENDYETTLPEPVVNKEVIEERKSEPVVTEKKKKLKEKILDIFKKKTEEPHTQESKPSENEDGERRPSRREGSNLATQVMVKFERPNEWMMGVKGAKASLTNRGNETIIKAVIEVSYYNEDNELLQTKTISFSNIGAKKTVTVSIPDHSFADHLDYKTISVVGGAEPFARR